MMTLLPGTPLGDNPDKYGITKTGAPNWSKHDVDIHQISDFDLLQLTGEEIADATLRMIAELSR